MKRQLARQLLTFVSVCRFLSMLIMLGALIAQVNTNPYTTSALNAIEFCSLCFTVLIMVCGMAFRVVRCHRKTR